MDERESGRIEIELTETQPPRWATGRAAGDRNPREGVVPPGPPRADQQPLVDARWKTAAIAALVGIGGLFVGWAAGSSGDGDQLAAAPAAVTSATEAPETTDAGFEDDPALVEPEAAEITADTEPPTTTTDPPVETEPIELDPRLAGLPYELVVVGGRNDLQYIDLAAATVTTVNIRGHSTGSGPVIADDGWALVRSEGGSDWQLWGDGASEPEDVPELDWMTFHQPGASTVWTSTGAINATEIVEHAPDGTPTGRTITVRGWPIAITPDGSFIVEATGGAYAVTTDQAVTQITSGRVLAVGPTTVLAEECDALLTCGVLVIDRVTGERQPVPITDETYFANLSQYSGPSPTGIAISPDGRWAVAVAVSGEQDFVSSRVVVIDLASGLAVPIGTGTNGNMTNVSWSDDSRFAFFLADGHLTAYDTATGDDVPIAPDAATRLTTFAVRSSTNTAPIVVAEDGASSQSTAPLSAPPVDIGE